MMNPQRNPSIHEPHTATTRHKSNRILRSTDVTHPTQLAPRLLQILQCMLMPPPPAAHDMNDHVMRAARRAAGWACAGCGGDGQRRLPSRARRWLQPGAAALPAKRDRAGPAVPAGRPGPRPAPPPPRRWPASKLSPLHAPPLSRLRHRLRRCPAMAHDYRQAWTMAWPICNGMEFPGQGLAWVLAMQAHPKPKPFVVCVCVCMYDRPCLQIQGTDQHPGRRTVLSNERRAPE